MSSEPETQAQSTSGAETGPARFEFRAWEQVDRAGGVLAEILDEL